MGKHVRNWLITGCSSGFGRALSELVLARGDHVLMTARNLATVADLVERYPRSARSIVLDLSEPATVGTTVGDAEAAFGPIDVLVNNAGYTLFAGVEEASSEQIRHIFATNFFGTVEVMRAVLPGMRARRSGRIINVSSMAAYSAGAGLPYYASTKFALTAVSEALRLEASHLGIKVTLVEPGAHRTAVRANWKMADPIEDYVPSLGAIRAVLKAGAGAERGSAALAAKAILTIADAEDPPMHLPLGQDAVDRANNKIAWLQRDMAAWRDLSLSTRHPEHGDG
jgi:NAD(P)-dependent dehydrogenase (short-subunit alcohol dehydrogenase family)